MAEQVDGKGVCGGTVTAFSTDSRKCTIGYTGGTSGTLSLAALKEVLSPVSAGAKQQQRMLALGAKVRQQHRTSALGAGVGQQQHTAALDAEVDPERQQHTAALDAGVGRQQRIAALDAKVEALGRLPQVVLGPKGGGDFGPNAAHLS